MKKGTKKRRREEGKRREKKKKGDERKKNKRICVHKRARGMTGRVKMFRQSSLFSRDNSVPFEAAENPQGQQGSDEKQPIKSKRHTLPQRLSSWLEASNPRIARP